ncbi:MAG: alkaline phosphatase family protein [Candidatus Omnitrophica bacterium]|nr:alkaline phosphatase family protein [Candidatus Omnitrophota bacterium]
MWRQNFPRRALSLLLCLGGLTAPASAQPARPVTVTVPATQRWTDTGVEVHPGDSLRLEASGTVRVFGISWREWFAGLAPHRFVGPQGTYRWPERDRDTARGSQFPLPTMADGPAPAFSLIAKIGEPGQPFYVGARFDGTAAESGRLWLGINDDRLNDNGGAWRVTITLDAIRPEPAPPVLAIEPGSRSGRPVPNARVLLLYIDGLRPDVLQEMAGQGLLPNIQRVFLDQGLRVANAFTVFPSNTLIANGSLFTGLFSDRTGIKSQNQFERTTLKPKGQLSKWLPDGFMPHPMTRVINLLDKYAPEQTHAFLVRRGVPTLATRLGKAYRFTTLPIAPVNPPPRWFHYAINTIGPFGVSTRLPRRLDAVNAQYAVEELLGDPDARVIAVWLPMADKTCHHSRRGQFGAARWDLAQADELLGRLMGRLREVGWDRSTYLILVSDHGHLGGEHGVNRACNLPREWAHRQLGCNVNVVGQEWRHPGIDERRFVFFDNQGAGQAKLFLPYESYFRGPWRRNRLFGLTHYELRPGQRSVNLLESLTAFHPPGWDGHGVRPVDLILVKLDERRVVLYRDDETQAILHRERDAAGRERYRYEPVRHLAQSQDGELHYEPPLAGRDPLGYLQEPGFLEATGGAAWLSQPHASREWLQATARSRYPDAVVTMAKFFAWQDPVRDLAAARDPDLVVTASPGWSFRSDDGEGTDHGYPLRESMRMTLLLAGPNLPHGVVERPQRIVDVLPTILEMIGWPDDPAPLDGEAITGIYDEHS